MLEQAGTCMRGYTIVLAQRGHRLIVANGSRQIGKNQQIHKSQQISYFIAAFCISGAGCSKGHSLYDI